jgi:hypothetical protein
MTTITKDDAPTLTPGSRALTALRALAGEPSESLTGMLGAADRQAQLLRNLLPVLGDQIPTHLTELIPIILIDYIDSIPSAGISFWARGQWNIHVRASDSVDCQTFTVLHELKHIIDHPIRRQQPDLIRDVDWEMLADHFASRVLKIRTESGPGVRRKEEYL